MKKEIKLFPQLEGLRAIAILLVIVYHWFPENVGINTLDNGPLGVTLFFVLSGFLITRILLLSRDYLTANGFLYTYKTFLLRRMLRISPLYYLTLFLFWIASYIPFIPEVSSRLFSDPLYYIAYLSNFLIENHHDWKDVFSPFWSLAVEEQFYLVWPILLLGVNRRYLRSAVILTIILGVFARVVLTFYGMSEGVLMPTCFDAFGFGGLWATDLFYNNSAKQFIKRLNYMVLPSFLLFLYFCVNEKNMLLETMFFRTSMSVFCLFFVAHASYKEGFKNLFGKILINPVLKYMGKISYGLYMFHMLVPSLIMPLLLKILNYYFHFGWNIPEYAWKLTCFAILVALASLSYFALEAPINRYKRFFTLRKAGVATTLIKLDNN